MNQCHDYKLSLVSLILIEDFLHSSFAFASKMNEVAFAIEYFEVEFLNYIEHPHESSSLASHSTSLVPQIYLPNSFYNSCKECAWSLNEIDYGEWRDVLGQGETKALTRNTTYHGAKTQILKAEST